MPALVYINKSEKWCVITGSAQPEPDFLQFQLSPYIEPVCVYGAYIIFPVYFDIFAALCFHSKHSGAFHLRNLKKISLMC